MGEPTFPYSKDKKQKYKEVAAELEEELIKLESNYKLKRKKARKQLRTIKEGGSVQLRRRSG